VVFIDDLRWDAFSQLAPRLRHAGVRTVRLTTRTGAIARVASRLLFDRHVTLASPADGRMVRQVIDEENVIDIQFVETLGDLVCDNLDLLDPSVAASVSARLAIMDKYAASRTFREADIRTPLVMLASETTPSAVATRFGLPVVTKKTVGCGGDHVTIAASVEELEATALGWDGDARHHFYEQYIAGEKLNYAATVSGDGIRQELTYRVSKWIQPVGTGMEIETVDDQRLLEFGRRAVAASGCTGLVNLDILRDVDGVDRLIDFNARAFGGGANFLTVGVDVSEGYLASLGVGTTPVSRCGPQPHARIRVFPACLGEARLEGGIASLAATFLRESWPYARWLGWRYWFSEVLRAPDMAKATLRQRRSARVASVRAPAAPSTTPARRSVGSSSDSAATGAVEITH
jgi:glutathione synthase/RimK-type ligase-like ATP-grasp enzyme